jgi:hypothetical protein
MTKTYNFTKDFATNTEGKKALIAAVPFLKPYFAKGKIAHHVDNYATGNFFIENEGHSGSPANASKQGKDWFFVYFPKENKLYVFQSGPLAEYLKLRLDLGTEYTVQNNTKGRTIRRSILNTSWLCLEVDLLNSWDVDVLKQHLLNPPTVATISAKTADVQKKTAAKIPTLLENLPTVELVE